MVQEIQFELSASERKQWAEFWNACHHAHPDQHYIWGDVERGKGRLPLYISGRVQGRLVCTALLSIRPLFLNKTFSLEAVCLRGPAFDDVSVFREIICFAIRQCKMLRIGSIQISPYWEFPEAGEVLSVLEELGFYPYGRGVGSRTDTGRIDTTRSEDEILASLSKWTRRDIKRAAKLDIDIHPVKSLDEAVLAFDSLDKMRRKRGLTPMPKGQFHRTFECVLANEDYGILFNAFSKERFLGALWLLRGPQVAMTAGYVVESGSCKKVHNSLSIGPPLWWEGIRWARSKGCSWLDVEGYSESTPKSSPIYHIHEFKRKFRPLPVQILSEHVFVCDPIVHKLHEACRFVRRGVRHGVSLSSQLRARLCSYRDRAVRFR